MVVTLEIAFLIVCVGLGLWWFSRTSRWSHMKAERGRGRDALRQDKHDFSRTQQELSRKTFHFDDAGPQSGGGGDFIGGGGL